MAKYNNIKTVIDGIIFDSKKEAKRYSELKLLEKAGLIGSLQLQVKFHQFALDNISWCFNTFYIFNNHGGINII